MKKYRAIIFIAILLVVTGIVAMIRFQSREDVPENAIKVILGEETRYIDIDELEYEQVSGVRVNGKGEEIEVEASGISLEKVIDSAAITEFTSIKVVAEDEYSAEITSAEMAEGAEAYLIQEEGESRLRLIIFGDQDSKRSVSNVEQIIIN